MDEQAPLVLQGVFGGHVWLQAVAASPLRVPHEGIVVEERRPVIQAVLATGWIVSSPRTASRSDPPVRR